MKGITAFLQGIGVRNVRPAVYAWFFNFLFTIFIYYGYYKVFTIPAGNTLLSGDGAGKISVFTFLADIFRHYKGSLPLVLSLAIVFTGVFVLVSIYVSAGIYSVLVEEERTSFTNLIANSTQNFFSMLKVSLANLLNLLAALLVPLLVLLVFAMAHTIFGKEALLEVLPWVWGGITALFLVFSAAIYDFSRIYKLYDDKNVFCALRKAVTFALSNKLSVLALFLSYGLSLALIYLLYFVLMGFVENLLYAVLIFAVYQGFMMVRYYLKIVVMRAEIRLVNREN
ncbi:MAG: hypothetical protein GY765_11235 [bacterium]|nr:hypothetical protein [bacterium]